MTDRPADASALSLWFSKQRRQLWRRLGWTIPALLLLYVLITVYWYRIIALYQSLVSGTPYLALVAQMPLYKFSHELVLVTVILVIAVLMLMVRSYHLPDELIVASSPADCYRALLRPVRFDTALVMWSVFSGMLVIPSMYYYFSNIRIYGLSTASRVMLPTVACWLVIYFIPLVPLGELIVYLATRKFLIRPVWYYGTPVLFLTASLLLIRFTPQVLLNALVPYLGVNTGNHGIFIVAGLLAAIHVSLAVVLRRLSCKPPKGRDPWRKN